MIFGSVTGGSGIPGETAGGAGQVLEELRHGGLRGKAIIRL
jgi:hypothetical protein